MYDRSYSANSPIMKIILVLVFAALLSMYTETMVVPSLRMFMREFNVSEADVAWILTAYLLAGVASTPLLGRLSDMYGRRKILTLALALYSTGLTLCSIAHSFSEIILARTIQGVGMCVFPIAFSIVREFPQKIAIAAQGMISAMFGVGAIIGIIVGSHVVEHFGWRSLFTSAAILAWTLTLLAHSILPPEARRPVREKIDIIGILLLAFGSTLLCYAFERAAHVGWSSTQVLSAIIVGLLCYVAFIAWERIVERPFVDIVRLSETNVFVANIVGFLTGFAMFIFFQAISMFMSVPRPAGLGFSIVETGLHMTPPAIAMILTAGVFAKLVPKIGIKKFLIASGVYGVIAGLIFQVVDLHNVPQLLTACSLLMSAVGAQLVATINLLVFSVREEEVGLMTALNMVIRLIGGSLGTAITGYLQSTITMSIIVGMMPVAGFIPVIAAMPSPQVVRICMLIVSMLSLVVTILSLRAREVLKTSS